MLLLEGTKNYFANYCGVDEMKQAVKIIFSTACVPIIYKLLQASS